MEVNGTGENQSQNCEKIKKEKGPVKYTTKTNTM